MRDPQTAFVARNALQCGFCAPEVIFGRAPARGALLRDG